MSPRVAVVLGAAGGIGSAVVRRLADMGWSVIGVDTDEGGLKRCETGWASESEFIPVVGDVTDRILLERAAEVAMRLGDLAAVVHCVGVVDRAPLLTGSVDEWEQVLRVNVLSTMVAVRVFCPLLEASSHGDLVIVGSVSARIHFVGEPAYLASKHAISAIAEMLRLELVESSTRVCVVQPGLVRTPLTDSSAYLDDVFGIVDPLEPVDVADAVAYAIAAPRRVTINEIVLRPSRQVL